MSVPRDSADRAPRAPSTARQDAPLAELRVIDLTGEHGILGPRMLAGLGAEVIRVEPPAGDPLRLRPPLVAPANGGDPSVGTYWLQMNGGKRSVVLDITASEGREQLWTLLEGADLLIESGRRAELEALGFDWDALATRCPALIYTTISPFGLEGPRADWLGGDLVTLAAGGLLYLCGDPDRAPLRVSVEQAPAHVGVNALVGSLIALRARRAGAPGQRVDVSMQEAITLTLGNSQAVYALDGIVSRRAGGGRASGEVGARLVWPCRDGYVAWARIPATMPLLHRWMADEGYEPDFDAEWWSQRPNAGPHVPPPEQVRALETRIEGFFLGFDKMYLYEEGQRRGVQICPVANIPDLLANKQLVARDFFQSVSHPELGRALTTPGAPFRMSASPWRVGRAPTLGEDTRAVLDSPPRRPAPPTARTAAGALDARQIFAGLRVVDFSWVGVGPLATQVLALYGAEVIRVESATRLDTFRNGQPLAPGDGPDRSAYWANVNRDKLGITLNLRHEGAADPVRRLVERADIVTESFSPGFMHEVGFDYASIQAINPRAIMISMSMEGQGGPHLGFKGFGLVLQATAGITGLTGWPDRPPVGTGVAYTDWFATHLAVTAMIAALEHRDRTDEGQYIDLSQLEAMTWGLDDAIARYSVTEEVATANGNRHPLYAPHGVFRCAGQDRWCAITVFDDAQWRALRTAMGDPAWATDPTLDTVAGRKAGEDEIEAQLTAWTVAHEPDALATRLQALGVPAYGVADARDVQHDPQLAARGHFWEIEHPVIGRTGWDAPAYRLSATPAYPLRPAPLLGEHNDHVYRELLGYDADDLAELVAAGVLE